MKTNILRYNLVAIFMAIANILNCQYQPYVDPDNRTINTNYAVGATNGSLSVNSRGEAVYEIPVFTSPGTAGMVPSIRILYNSNYRDGILGPGWTIAGLSVIQRVPQNFYNDDTRKGITLTSADRFALDSNRLVLSSGVYGGDQSVYKAEIETFSRITARGVSGNGPSWFNVDTKDGQTIEYGNTPDSKVEANGTTTVRLWRVNKITDRYGNYIKFTYNEINGESYLSKIDYTGNGSGTQPYNSLKFFYNTRNDINNPYVGGRLVPSTVILSSIRMETEGTLVREYQLKYFTDSFNKTRLNELKELGNDGSSLNSTLYGWTETIAAFSSADVFSPNQVSTFYFGDFNGDGRRDFIRLWRKSTYLPTDTWKVYLAEASGSSFNLIYTGTLGAGYKGIVIADNDGDGMDNIYLHRIPEPLIYKFENYLYDQNLGTINRNQPADLIYEDIVSVNTLTGDFDGNGKTDLLILDAMKNYFAASGITVATGGMPAFNSPDAIRTLDFDGDGRDELLVIKNNNSFIYQYDNMTQIFNPVYSSSTFPIKDDRIFIGDFNGDLKDDILSYRGGWTLKFSTGTGFQVSGNIPALRNFDPAASILDNNYYIGDFNGDGMDDILEAYKSGSSSILKVYVSYGNGKTTVFSNTYTKSAINQDYLNIGTFSGKGCDQVFYYDYSLSANKVNLVSFFSGTPPAKINKIYDGLDNKIKIAYKRLNADTLFYRFRSWSSVYPLITLKNNYQAVDSVSRSGGVYNNSTENEITVTYTYEGLKIHRLGKNNLGFSLVKEYNSATERSSKTKYIFDPVYFFISSRLVFDDEFSADSIYVTNWSRKEYPNKVIFPYIISNRSFDPLAGFQSVSGYTLDNYGNITGKSTSSRKKGSPPEYTESITFSGYSAYGNWGIPNNPQSMLISRSIKSLPAVTKEIVFTYNSNGRIMTETTYPGTAKAVTKTYTYNLYGNNESVTVSAQGLIPRVSSYQYDSKNRFVTSIEQPDSNSVSYTRDPGTGNMLTETAIDSKITTYQYDAFGRQKKVITPLGHEIVTSINWGNSIPDIRALYKVQTIAPGRPDVINYYDKLGRIIRTESEAPGGSVIQDKYYNPDGTTEKVTYPYRSGDAQKWIEYGYDEYGRLISENNNTLTTTYHYGKDTTKITLPSGKKKTTIFNSQSQVTQVIDNDNTITSYNYNSFGNVSAITTPGNSVNFYYDAFGLQDSLYNKNSGGMKFTYNAFGELLSRKDARGLSTTYQYDILGRITQQTSPEGTKYYNYYHSGNGIRQLAGITGPGGVTEGFNYDNFGRVSQYSRSITNEISMNLSYGYDQYGNNTAITYPSGLVIQNVFDQYGNLTEIRKSDGTLIWQLNSITATGKPEEVTLGPGTFTRTFEYDAFENISSIVSGEWRQSFNFDGASGNLMSRSYMNGDSTFMRTENFLFDTRERLTTSQVNGLSQKVVTYDQTGNILTKTDAGTYTYNSAKVNALASVTFIRGAISTNLQTIAYNSQNKATAISEDVNSYNIVYGADGERIKSQLYNNSVLSKTKYYAPGYEKITTTGGTVENHYIGSPYGLEAIIVKAGTSETMYLAETDHLGSLTGLKNTAGVYVERFSYDPWGRRRNPTDWSFNSVPAASITDRGFTGHEHLDIFRLINMNGRLYDPVTGRFLNADPVIDNLGGAQGLNSYTYCLNNPLKYIDPSGYTVTMPDPWAAYIRFCARGYNEGYSNFYDQFWDQYCDYSFSSGGGGSFSMTLTWHTWKEYTSIINDVPVAIVAEKVNHSATIQIPFSEPGAFNAASNGDTYKFRNPEANIITTIASISGLYGKHNLIINTIESAFRKDKILPFSVNINTGKVTWANPKFLNYAKWAGFVGISGDVTCFIGAYYNGGQHGWTTEHILDLGFAGVGFIQGYGDAITLYYMGEKWFFKDVLMAPNSEERTNMIMRMSSSWYCFAEGTQVMMGDRTTRNIELIQLGDSVLTFNFTTKEFEINRVLRIDEPVHHKLVKVVFSNSIEILSTEDHPYYVKDKGWCSYNPQQTFNNYGIRTGKLESSDLCFTVKGSRLKTVRISKIQPFEKTMKTFNITKISDSNSYFVNGILVNNESEPR